MTSAAASLLVGDRRERLGDVGLVGDGDRLGARTEVARQRGALLGGADRMVVLDLVDRRRLRGRRDRVAHAGRVAQRRHRLRESGLPDADHDQPAAGEQLDRRLDRRAGLVGAVVGDDGGLLRALGMTRSPPPRRAVRLTRIGGCAAAPAWRIVCATSPRQGGAMAVEDIEEMGPIDYIVLEWPGRQPDGSVAPLIVDLVDRGLIRIIDVAIMAKDEDGTVAALDLGRARGRVLRVRGRVDRTARPGGPRRGRRRPGAGHVGRRAGVGEPLGSARRRRGAQVRRPARRQRPHPGPGHPRRARRGRRRGHHLRTRERACPD